MAVDRTLLSILHKPVATNGRFDERWYARLDRFVKDIGALEDAQSTFTAADTALDTRLDALEASTSGLPSETTYTVPAAGNPTTYVVSHLYRRQYLYNSSRNWIIQPPTSACTVDMLIMPDVTSGPGSVTFSGGWLSTSVGVGDAVDFATFPFSGFLVRIVRIDIRSTYNARRVS
jgi:hypothetical protein